MNEEKPDREFHIFFADGSDVLFEDVNLGVNSEMVVITYRDGSKDCWLREKIKRVHVPKPAPVH